MITDFKIFESRSNVIDVYEYNTLKDKNIHYPINKVYFNRLSDKDSRYFELNPKKDIRKYKGNGISILIDNLESWKDFPKRKNSVIFTFGEPDEELSNWHGSNIYEVLPYDNAKIAVSSVKDLNIRSKYTETTLLKYFFNDDCNSYYLFINNFIAYLKSNIEIFNFSHDEKYNICRIYTHDTLDDIYAKADSIINICKNNKHILNNTSDFEYESNAIANMKLFLQYFDENKFISFKQYVNKYMSPETFGCKIYTVEELIKMEPTSTECWTENTCILKLT